MSTPRHGSPCPVCNHDTYAFEKHCHICGADRWNEEPRCPDCGSSDVVFVWADADFSDASDGAAPATRRGCKGCGNMVMLDA